MARVFARRGIDVISDNHARVAFVVEPGERVHVTPPTHPDFDLTDDELERLTAPGGK
jgi:hypothetical protein